MVGVERIDGGPRSVVVVGAGIVGLSTAWFLQDRGVKVTVVDRTGVAAGASWGNGGWIAPGLTLPTNSAGVLRDGLHALGDPSAPVRFPATADPRLAEFLSRFVGNYGGSSWRQTMRANAPLNEDCIEVFDVLIANGVDAPVTDGPITTVFRSTAAAENMLWRLRQLEKAGQTLYVTALSGDALREQVPLTSPLVTAGLNVNAQRFVDPRRFVEALGREVVVERGATIRRLEIRDVLSSSSGVTVQSRRMALTADAVVIATGAQLPELVSRWLRMPVQSGCGYSFTVPVQRPIPSPIYLPSARLACTPYKGAMRVSGTMEFRHRHEPVIPQRIEAIVASASPLLDGACWAERSDQWVGAYSVTADGRPLIGEVARGVYVAGGHGMWGMAHGPVTGRLLAEQITTGKQPQALAAFDPLRRSGRRHS